MFFIAQKAYVSSLLTRTLCPSFCFKNPDHASEQHLNLIRLFVVLVGCPDLIPVSE
jgi:hypothetical protein